jgi:hypothetical protein
MTLSDPLGIHNSLKDLAFIDLPIDLRRRELCVGSEVPTLVSAMSVDSTPDEVRHSTHPVIARRKL